jgi:peptidyl-prolyl cis-trans isomerase SurA
MTMRLGQLGVMVLAGMCVPAVLAQGGTAAQKASVAKSTTAPAAAGPKMPTVSGEELDRVVAIVNDDLVLDSDVSEEERFEQMQPIGLSGTAATFDRNKAIERLIDRDLILQQAQQEPGLEVSDEDLDKEIAALKKELPGCRKTDCTTAAGWNAYLTANGFTPDAFRDRWRQRMEVLAFIEERFRTGIRIAPADIKKYYDTTMLPEYEKQHQTPPPLDKISDRIQQVLLQHPGESAP